MSTVISAFEAVMLVCFGVSWPVSVVKSYRARTTKGKSILFLLAIWIGYVFGLAGKILLAVETGSIPYVLFIYAFNLIVVSLDLILYFRTLRLDKKAAGTGGKEKVRICIGAGGGQTAPPPRLSKKAPCGLCRRAHHVDLLR